MLASLSSPPTTKMDEVSYGTHPLQKIKLFKHDLKNERTIVFVHGGAWRDPNNTFMDFADLAQQLDDLPATNLIGVNYRLSPEVEHPFHLMDLVCAIDKIQQLNGPTEWTFVGHSVGATLILQLLNYQDIIGLTKQSPTMCYHALDLKISSIFFIDGIYDIVDLIEEYGDPYYLFVKPAFGLESYADASQMTWKLKDRELDKEFRAVIIQSKEDELLSERQSSRFFEFIHKRCLSCIYTCQDFGKHEEVYKRKEVADIIRREYIFEPCYSEDDSTI